MVKTMGVEPKKFMSQGVPVKALYSRGVKVWPTELVEGDFTFVINGTFYYITCMPGEELNFTIDWGDGTETIVDSFDISLRMHAYSSDQEWTITIKKYISGWITFDSINTSRILSPFPPSATRTSYARCLSHTDIDFIPEDLFAGSPNAIDFSEAFYWAQRLKHIPERLFAKNPKAKFFTNTFALTALEAVPDKLFENNSEVTTFRGCFSQIYFPFTFSSEFKPHSNVLARDTDYSDMFGLPFDHGEYTRRYGKVPELWKIAIASSNNSAGCFYGCETADNYDDIPDDWK